MATTPDVVYQPGIGGAPFGNALFVNALGSDYAANSAYGATTTDLVSRSLREAIFDAAPAKYAIMTLLFQQQFETVDSDEFYYREQTFGRAPLVSNAITAAVAAVPGGTVTQTYTLTAASFNLSLDMIIGFNDAGNTKGIVRALPGGNTVTIESQTGAGLPATIVGDILIPMSTFRADGQSIFQTYQRLETIERYNYVQGFLRARRWGKKELIKFQNKQSTNYLQKDADELMKQVRLDVFASYINGTRGEFRTAVGEPGKSMGGWYPTMVAAGSASATTTTAGLQATLEALAFATDYKSEGAPRFLVAVPRVLNEISKIYKQSLTRYAPSDRIADLELDELRFGGLRLVLVPCMLLQEPSLFPLSFANKIFCLDLETIKPVQMKGLPSFDMGGTLMMEGQNGTREAFKDLYVEANLGSMMDNPLSSFTIDLI